MRICFKMNGFLLGESNFATLYSPLFSMGLNSHRKEQISFLKEEIHIERAILSIQATIKVVSLHINGRKSTQAYPQTLRCSFNSPATDFVRLSIVS